MLNSGGNSPERKQKYVHIENQQRNLRAQFLNVECTVLEYTDAVSYLLHLND